MSLIRVRNSEDGEEMFFDDLELSEAEHEAIRQLKSLHTSPYCGCPDGTDCDLRDCNLASQVVIEIVSCNPSTITRVKSAEDLILDDFRAEEKPLITKKTDTLES